MTRRSGFTPYFPSGTVVIVALGLFFVFGCDRSDESDLKMQLRAEQGDPEAQTMLGLICERGDHARGILRNQKAAAAWYIRAANQDYPQAKVYLGVLYENGGGVGKDLAKAVDWYRNAAEQEYPKAQIYLGEMYERGVGVQQDYAEAYKWFHLAATQGWAEGVACQESLAHWMTPEQLVAAKRRIAAFTPRKSSTHSAVIH